jgi:hypothetical protein
MHLFSKTELEIINKTVRLNHKIENKIILLEKIYVGPLFYREGMWNSYVLELRKNNIDDSLINSYKKNNSNYSMVIDKNNKFDFDFIWHEQYEKNKENFNCIEKIRISGIGINENKTKAIFLLERMSENEGDGKTYLFEKEGEQWNIANVIDCYEIHRMINGKLS